MSDEYEYVFIDKSGHCFEDYQLCSKTSPKDEIDKMVDKEFGKDTEGGELVLEICLFFGTTLLKLALIGVRIFTLRK